jgi:hypothetical protein
MCVSVCQVISGGDAFLITTVAAPPAPVPVPAPPVPPQPDAAQVAAAATYSAVGSTNAEGTTAVCLYDFLLIAGARDATGVEADRYCGGALNPAPLGGAPVNPLTRPVPLGGSPTSVQVCSKLTCNFVISRNRYQYLIVAYKHSSSQAIQDDVPDGQH